MNKNKYVMNGTRRGRFDKYVMNGTRRGRFDYIAIPIRAKAPPTQTLHTPIIKPNACVPYTCRL
jgi:hypothetical protein